MNIKSRAIQAVTLSFFAAASIVSRGSAQDEEIKAPEVITDAICEQDVRGLFHGFLDELNQTEPENTVLINIMKETIEALEKRQKSFKSDL